MLEAAMFGLPYAGRIPDFAGMPPRGGAGYFGRAGGQRSVDPDVLEGRMLREEQEIAFQESLEVRAGGFVPWCAQAVCASGYCCDDGASPSRDHQPGIPSFPLDSQFALSQVVQESLPMCSCLSCSRSGVSLCVRSSVAPRTHESMPPVKGASRCLSASHRRTDENRRKQTAAHVKLGRPRRWRRPDGGRLRQRPSVQLQSYVPRWS